MCFLANLDELIKQKSAEQFRCFTYVRHLIKNKVKSVEKKKKSKADSPLEQGRGQHTEERDCCFVETSVWSLRSSNCASVSHTPCMSIYLSIQLSTYVIKYISPIHQRKASPGEHFKYDNNKPFCQQFVSVNKFVFAALLDLKGSSNSKILCFFTFLLYLRATLLTTFELIVYVLDWWQELSKQNEPQTFETGPQFSKSNKSLSLCKTLAETIESPFRKI